MRLALRAGPLSAVFETDTGFLREVRWGSAEALRAVYAAVRDARWGTVPPGLTRLRLEESEARFALVAEGRVEDAAQGVALAWRLEAVGRVGANEREGALEVVYEGRAESDFRRNRIGLCALHPAELAGTPCTVLHPDGSETPSRFPEAIAPHQPFLAVVGLRHALGSGARLELSFTGEVFETEDQRNWTDASFKTYGTPLSEPVPVLVRAGEVVRQSLKARFFGPPPQRFTPSALTLRPLGGARPLPEIGLARASRSPSDRERALLSELKLAHLRAERRSGTSEADLGLAADEARTLGTRLELALFLRDASELRGLPDALAGLSLERLILVGEGVDMLPRNLLEQALEALGGLGVPLVLGTDGYFTELNRNRPPDALLARLGGLAYSLNPQVHAFDTRSLAETLTVQGQTVQNARAFGGKPVHVTPITLRMRSSATPAPASRADPRQQAPFGAAWTLGSVGALAAGGAASATYYETLGPLGVLDEDGVFPLYHVLADLALAVRATPFAASAPFEVCGLLLERAEGRRVLLANLTDEERAVRLELSEPGRFGVRTLDETTRDAAQRDPAAFHAARHGSLDSGELWLLQPHAYLCADEEPA